MIHCLVKYIYMTVVSSKSTCEKDDYPVRQSVQLDVVFAVDTVVLENG